MTKRDKRLQKLRQNPRQVSFEEIKQVLEDYGYIHVRTQGSHHTDTSQRANETGVSAFPIIARSRFPIFGKRCGTSMKSVNKSSQKRIM